ncbi:N-acetylmannosamine kinase [Propionigenium maris DSM 9537]|uniref:N-acetylmannosamine kinase n=1 Tax=Propionigenium maris DSM 9537 TaxID=1123000 RepID=A0A9W6GK41_9FUSO|nr:ROK family protein [Propionigenium maris]GLI56619.1 N-acetylmannosamine kinase [Propionigenium maris DSM 9537]
MDKRFILFDIGGTGVKYGVTDAHGKFLVRESFFTQPERGSNDLLGRMGERVDSCMKEYTLSGIGISATGQVDYSSGRISAATDLIKGWVGTNLKKYFEDKYDLPVIVENDVNCVALGEMWLGAGRDLDNFISIALGTGIGGGIILNRRLFRGSHYSAGEFGHMKIRTEGRLCRCGDRGCYEAHASTLALVSLVKEVTGERNITGEEIFQYEKAGVEPYKGIVSQWIRDIGDGLKNIVVSFNPEALIIGGGVSAQGEYLLDKIREDLKAKLQENFYENLDIMGAALKNDAGMLGALYLLREEIRED